MNVAYVAGAGGMKAGSSMVSRFSSAGGIAGIAETLWNDTVVAPEFDMTGPFEGPGYEAYPVEPDCET